MKRAAKRCKFSYGTFPDIVALGLVVRDTNREEHARQMSRFGGRETGLVLPDSPTPASVVLPPRVPGNCGGSFLLGGARIELARGHITGAEAAAQGCTVHLIAGEVAEAIDDRPIVTWDYKTFGTGIYLTGKTLDKSFLSEAQITAMGGKKCFKRTLSTVHEMTLLVVESKSKWRLTTKGKHAIELKKPIATFEMLQEYFELGLHAAGQEDNI